VGASKWFAGSVPQHEISKEAHWLTENYHWLADEYSGRAGVANFWVAVVEEGVVDVDGDPEALQTRVSEAHGPGVALFAAVSRERMG